MRAVDLRVKAGKLAHTYEHMRVWLDHEHCVPVDFARQATARAPSTFASHFKTTSWPKPFSASSLVRRFRGPAAGPPRHGPARD